MAWYDNFFHGLVQRAWKDAQTDEQTQLEVDFLYDMLNLAPGSHVLDVFCGYGRHALELARQGCRVTGIDLSPEYIDELKVAADSLPLEAFCGDFLQWHPTTQFDAAYCLGNSFSFFPPDTLSQFLQKIADSLPTGGRFVADTGMIAESVLPGFQERSWMPIGDIWLLVENNYDVTQGRIDSQLTYLQQGHIETRTAQHYIYTVAEMARYMKRAGLEVKHYWSDLEGSDFMLGDDRLLLISDKF